MIREAFEALKEWAIVLFWLGVVGIVVACFAVLAQAHGFYPHECCHDRDCAPIASYRVDHVTGGYLVDGLHYVPEAQARNSPDGRYHACYPVMQGKPRCFFRPPMSM